jgi:hypothetical protein
MAQQAGADFVLEFLQVDSTLFGDLPAGYGTFQVDDGPRHTDIRLRLGSNVDADTDSNPIHLLPGTTGVNSAKR